MCVEDEDGTVAWQGRVDSEPGALISALTAWKDSIGLVGMEACPLSEWIYAGLAAAGFNVRCIETRHARRFLSSRPNKTDKNDARGIADMTRPGHFKPVHVKSLAADAVGNPEAGEHDPRPSSRSRHQGRHGAPLPLPGTD